MVVNRAGRVGDLKSTLALVMEMQTVCLASFQFCFGPVFHHCASYPPYWNDNIYFYAIICWKFAIYILILVLQELTVKRML